MLDDLPRTSGGNKNGSNHGDARVQTEASAPANRDEEFDLRENYRSAVECLIHCESVMMSLHNQLTLKDERIVSLERQQLVKQMAVKDVLEDGQMMRESFQQEFQEQLALKDEHIAGLENRLVEMSIALASSKTLEDELRQAISSCVCGTENGSNERLTDDVPAVTEASLSASRKVFSDACAPARPRSKSFSDMAAQGKSSHDLRHASGPQKIRDQRQRSFSLSGLRMSWGTAADSSALDDSSRRSRNVLERIFRGCDRNGETQKVKEDIIGSCNTNDNGVLHSNTSSNFVSRH